MGNVFAIAQKELKSYFSSAIAWVIVGFYALLFGYFFIAMLSFFVRQSMQMGMGPNMNINQSVIRPLFLNSSVLILFVGPIITMRTYAEEKRAGTMELLLTSPLTDWQIILGKFLGAMGLYAAMQVVTLVYMSILFIYGNPEWKPLIAGYLGMLLLGGCFISMGLLISSLTKSQMVAAMATFAVFLLLWVIDWIGDFGGPTAQMIVQNLSIVQHLDDFVKGVIDTKHVVYYLSFITFGLFLTAKSVDVERWRG